ncbi:hypothetical protein, partial [Pandoraea pneumonica]
EPIRLQVGRWGAEYAYATGGDLGSFACNCSAGFQLVASGFCYEIRIKAVLCTDNVKKLKS